MVSLGQTDGLSEVPEERMPCMYIEVCACVN